ncbi:MAG: cupin domain-containing protein [Anaerolineae bacterium]
MTKTGHTIENPVTGDRVIFLETSGGTAAELLKVEYVITARETVPHLEVHIHRENHERFEVIQGNLGVLVNDEREVLNPGEVAEIPPGISHTIWNAGDGEVRILTEIRPPGEFQTFWETLFGLARDGKLNEKGVPSILQAAILADLISTYPPGPPMFFTRSLVGILAWLGRLVGYRGRYARYSD